MANRSLWEVIPLQAGTQHLVGDNEPSNVADRPGLRIVPLTLKQAVLQPDRGTSIAPSTELFDACAQAERELAALPLPKRFRVYLGGFAACEQWIDRRAAEILADQLSARGTA